MRAPRRGDRTRAKVKRGEAPTRFLGPANGSSAGLTKKYAPSTAQ